MLLKRRGGGREEEEAKNKGRHRAKGRKRIRKSNGLKTLPCPDLE